MKRALLLTLAFTMLATGVFAGGRNRKKQKAQTVSAAVGVNDKEIQWMSLDDVQAAMKKEPRKVWIDVYTDWCGWCKHMDKTTFSNPHVIKYMNEHFYSVKLDAEQREDIRFMGKMYPAANPAGSRTPHPFAVELLKAEMSYPTSVFMEKNFQSPQIIPGYQDVKTMEMVLKYLAEEIYRKTPFPDYQSSFKPSWMLP